MKLPFIGFANISISFDWSFTSASSSPFFKNEGFIFLRFIPYCFFCFESSLSATLFSLRSSLIFLLHSYPPSLYPPAFSQLRTALIIPLSSSHSAILTLSHLFSTLIDPLMFRSICTYLLNWISLNQLYQLCSIFCSSGPSNLS